MKILLVAATDGEISQLKGISSDSHTIDFLVTGAGMVATAYKLGRCLGDKKYDLIINAGIAGSFDRTITIGEVVVVKEDIFSEVGAEDGNEFLNMEALGLPGNFKFENAHSLKALSGYKQVRSITVNTVHGNDESISKVMRRYNPQIESMEGAAFFYVCSEEKIHCIQLRAISNYVERRNRESWNIPLALKNLQSAISKLILEI
jgi:futalosine hydrolase